MSGSMWSALDAAFGARQVVVNRYWRANPDRVLGQHWHGD